MAFLIAVLSGWRKNRYPVKIRIETVVLTLATTPVVSIKKE
ncbi:MAG: hypothetical protein JG768_1408 [Fusobacteriales bacterium]|nr:hypothetical protein [Fusobacteriales bacterium]